MDPSHLSSHHDRWLQTNISCPDLFNDSIIRRLLILPLLLSLMSSFEVLILIADTQMDPSSFYSHFFSLQRDKIIRLLIYFTILSPVHWVQYLDSCRHFFVFVLHWVYC